MGPNDARNTVNICMDWLRGENGCRYGRGCKFEHSKNPYVCADWKKGSCKYGDRCCYVHDIDITSGVQKWSNGRYCVPCIVDSGMREQIRYQIQSLTFLDSDALLEAVLDRLMTYDTSTVLEIAADPGRVYSVARKCKSEEAMFPSAPGVAPDMLPFQMHPLRAARRNPQMTL